MHAAAHPKRDAAAAALSSAAEEPRKRNRADSEDCKEFVIAVTELECCICNEPYETTAEEGKPDRMPRVLTTCGHDFCTSCLAGMVRDGAVECALGCGMHRIQLPKDIAAASITSPMEWARLIPLNRGMIAVMRELERKLVALRKQMAPAAVAAAAAAASTAAAFAGCMLPKCTEAATLHCTDCKLDYCAKHDRTLHALRISRMPQVACPCTPRLRRCGEPSCASASIRQLRSIAIACSTSWSSSPPV